MVQYSISEDAAYCIYCILFGGDNSSKCGVHFVPFHYAGFTDWKNAKGVNVMHYRIMKVVRLTRLLQLKL